MEATLLQLEAYKSEPANIIVRGLVQENTFLMSYVNEIDFVTEQITQSIHGEGYVGNEASCTLIKGPDMITDIFLHTTVIVPQRKRSTPAPWIWRRFAGFEMVKRASLYIGGTQVCDEDGDWWRHVVELSATNDNQYEAYESLTGSTPLMRTGMQEVLSTEVDNLFDPQVGDSNLFLDGENRLVRECIIPCLFWFGRYRDAAFAFGALHDTDVTLKFVFRQATELITESTDPAATATKSSLPSAAIVSRDLVVEGVFLQPEQAAIVANRQETLIQQVSILETEIHGGGQSRINFKFNLDALHLPVTQFVWSFEADNAILASGDPIQATSDIVGNTKTITKVKKIGDKYYYIPGDLTAIMESAQLMLSGMARTPKRRALFWNTWEPTRVGQRVPDEGIYVLSFASSPNKFRPTGYLNPSEFDTKTLNIVLSEHAFPKNAHALSAHAGITYDSSQQGQSNTAVRAKLFAPNYNILITHDGKGTVLYQ